MGTSNSDAASYLAAFLSNIQDTDLQGLAAASVEAVEYFTPLCSLAHSSQSSSTDESLVEMARNIVTSIELGLQAVIYTEYIVSWLREVHDWWKVSPQEIASSSKDCQECLGQVLDAIRTAIEGIESVMRQRINARIIPAKVISETPPISDALLSNVVSKIESEKPAERLLEQLKKFSDSWTWPEERGQTGRRQQRLDDLVSDCTEKFKKSCRAYFTIMRLIPTKDQAVLPSFSKIPILNQNSHWVRLDVYRPWLPIERATLNQSCKEYQFLLSISRTRWDVVDKIGKNLYVILENLSPFLPLSLLKNSCLSAEEVAAVIQSYLEAIEVIPTAVDFGSRFYQKIFDRFDPSSMGEIYLKYAWMPPNFDSMCADAENARSYWEEASGKLKIAWEKLKVVCQRNDDDTIWIELPIEVFEPGRRGASLGDIRGLLKRKQVDFENLNQQVAEMLRSWEWANTSVVDHNVDSLFDSRQGISGSSVMPVKQNDVFQISEVVDTNYLLLSEIGKILRVHQGIFPSLKLRGLSDWVPQFGGRRYPFRFDETRKAPSYRISVHWKRKPRRLEDVLENQKMPVNEKSPPEKISDAKGKDEISKDASTKQSEDESFAGDWSW